MQTFALIVAGWCFLSLLAAIPAGVFFKNAQASDDDARQLSDRRNHIINEGRN